MKRRGFLQTIIGLAGTIAIPATGSSQRNRQKQARAQLLKTSLAGFQYYEGERLFPQLKIGDPLQLRRAPDNKYDIRAVEVYWRGNMLGHIPRVANMSVSQMLDSGQPLTASIIRLTSSDDPWQCIRFVVKRDISIHTSRV